MVAQRPAQDTSVSTNSRLGSPASNAVEPDWTDQVTDLIVDLVDSARDKTTGPILTVARGLVYGTVMLFVAMVLFVAGLAFGGRAISLLPIPEWLSYAILGTVFVLIGAICWKRRSP